MYPLTQLSDELHKYYGVYTGDAEEWLRWLIDDGYCDQEIICIYHITIPPRPAFYVTDDPASGGWAGEDASREVPQGRIIFSTIPKIPARYIKLVKKMTQSEYAEANPDRDEWEAYDDEFEED